MRPSFELRTEQDVQIPRLFNFDLPPLKKTGKALPELANSSAIHRILDVASGNGEWALRAAQAGPHLQIVSVERDPQLVTYAQAQAQAQRVDNVSFTVMDPFQLSDIADGTFDLVNARFLVGLLSAEDWPKVLREFVRVTRPGGIIRLTENDLPITNSPAYGQLGELISESLYVTKRSFSSEGRLLSAAPTLKRLLRDSGCHDVRQAVSITNFSAGMEAHADIYQDVATTYRLVQPFLVSTKVTTQQDVERLYQQMLTEMQSPDFLAVAFYLTVWGTTS